jgi:transketolase
MSIEPINERWTAFGWDVSEIDGNDMESIVKALDEINFRGGKPHLIISKTTKGKGISCMENELKWHHGIPKEDEYKQYLSELEARIEQLSATTGRGVS